MAVKTVEELKRELKEMCEKTDTRISGMEFLAWNFLSSFTWNHYIGQKLNPLPMQ